MQFPPGSNFYELYFSAQHLPSSKLFTYFLHIKEIICVYPVQQLVRYTLISTGGSYPQPYYAIPTRQQLLWVIYFCPTSAQFKIIYIISSHKGNHMCLSCSTIIEIYTYFNWWLIPSRFYVMSYLQTSRSWLALPSESSYSFITSIMSQTRHTIHPRHDHSQTWPTLDFFNCQLSLNPVVSCKQKK